LYKIDVTFKDQNKVVLAGMNVYVNDGYKTITFVTDEDGKFTAELITGKWAVKTNSAVSKTFVAYIVIQDNQALNPTNFDLIVETNQSNCTPNKQIEVLKYETPKYPPAARAVGATGEVVINVKIDKDGKVITSKAESGHPLLRLTAENSANLWLFSQDELAERECKIVIAFVLSDKDKTFSKFSKPNRLEVYSEIPRIH
jgi:Gram-negative bacterial TonB protein C-terminal